MKFLLDFYRSAGVYYWQDEGRTRRGTMARRKGRNAMKVDIHGELMAMDESARKMLLSDLSYPGNILWATDEYAELGDGFAPDMEITMDCLEDPRFRLRCRWEKEEEAKKGRTKRRAEVFTPRKVVRRMHDMLADENHEVLRGPWRGMAARTYLEITCGEGPYIATRYDPEDGTLVPYAYRAGMLDRILHAVRMEEGDDPDAWLRGAVLAVYSQYGYELSGDSLLIARVNVFMSVVERYRDFFGLELGPERQRMLACIIACNLFQCDGLTSLEPPRRVEDGSTVEIRANLMNWQAMRIEPFFPDEMFEDAMKEREKERKKAAAAAARKARKAAEANR